MPSNCVEFNILAWSNRTPGVRLLQSRTAQVVLNSAPEAFIGAEVDSSSQLESNFGFEAFLALAKLPVRWEMISTAYTGSRKDLLNTLFRLFQSGKRNRYDSGVEFR